MLQNIMNMCGVSRDEAKKLLLEEIKMARENFAADGDLLRAVEDVLSDLGIDADYEMQIAEMICA